MVFSGNDILKFFFSISKFLSFITLRLITDIARFFCFVFKKRPNPVYPMCELPTKLKEEPHYPQKEMSWL